MYYFRDFDDSIGDIQIAGAEYSSLIKLCCLHSEYGSMTFTSQEQVNRFSKDLCLERIELLGDEKDQRTHRGFFKCSAETERFLLTHVNDFFQWVDFDGYCNPEDLTFYRKDGSVFFWSETHEGVCALLNRKEENVNTVISNIGWKYHNPQDGNVWGIPAFLM